MKRYRPFLLREYDVLPILVQFFIFINQGIYRGSAPWLSFKWFNIKRKIKRINCWKDRHEFIRRNWLDKDSKPIPYFCCDNCGEQRSTRLDIQQIYLLYRLYVLTNK